MIIVLINAEEGIVTICGRTVEEIPWDDVDRISAKISGQQVYYVTSAEEASGDDVLDVIVQASGSSAPRKRPPGKKKTGRLVMHCTTRGAVVAKSIDPNEDNILFDSPLDFHPIFGTLETLYSKYPDIEKYVDMGYIEIIDSSEEKEVRAKYKAVMEKLKSRRPGKASKDNNARRMIDKARNRSQLLDDNEDDDVEEDDPTRIDVVDDGGDADGSNILLDDEQKKILKQLGKI